MHPAPNSCETVKLNANILPVQGRLVRLFAGEELGCGMEGIQRRMQDLVQVVPDLGEALLQRLLSAAISTCLWKLQCLTNMTILRHLYLGIFSNTEFLCFIPGMLHPPTCPPPPAHPWDAPPSSSHPSPCIRSAVRHPSPCTILGLLHPTSHASPCALGVLHALALYVLASSRNLPYPPTCSTQLLTPFPPSSSSLEPT